MCTACHRLNRIEDHGHQTEVREASTRNGIVGDEDVRLRNVKKEPVAKRCDTDPFEVPVCKIGAVEVLQALGCSVQLLSRMSEGSGGKFDVTN